MNDFQIEISGYKFCILFQFSIIIIVDKNYLFAM